MHGEDGGVCWRRRGGAGAGVPETLSEDLQAAQQSQFHGQGGDFAGGCQLVTGERTAFLWVGWSGIKGWWIDVNYFEENLNVVPLVLLVLFWNEIWSFTSVIQDDN